MASVRQLINALETLVEAGDIKGEDLVVISGDAEGNHHGVWDGMVADHCLYDGEEVYDVSEAYEADASAKSSIVLYPV